MSEPAPVTGWRRWAYLLLAALFFALGALGMILPGLPTTPFLLLTSYLLVRSHPALNARLLQSRFFGPILRDWHEHRAIRRHVKYKTIGLILLVLGATLYFGPLAGAAKLGVVALVCVGLAVVVRLPTVPGESTAGGSKEKSLRSTLSNSEQAGFQPPRPPQGPRGRNAAESTGDIESRT